MTDLINLITQNGIGIVCVAYMIYFQNTTMKDMNKTLTSIQTNLILINERLESIESKKRGSKNE
jgi:predicted Ser/Thr protein kinase